MLSSLPAFLIQNIRQASSPVFSQNPPCNLLGPTTEPRKAVGIDPSSMKNPLRLFIPALISLCPLAAEETEFTIGLDYADAPECRENPGVPKGRIVEFTMDSKDSKIYKGIAKDRKGTVPYQRKVAVYIPARYYPVK